MPYSSRALPPTIKKTRFTEEPKPVSDPTNNSIPSLLQLNVNAPPDIEIDLDDLKSEDEDSPRSNGDNRSRKRGRDERDSGTRDRSGGRVTRWNRY